MSTSGQPNNMVEVRIPILQRSTSVVDQDYGGQGGQFADEMRRMEEEMNKLTGQINEGNKKIASRIVQKTTTTTTRTTSGGGGMPMQPQQQSAIQYNQQPQSQTSHTSTYSHQTSGTQGQPHQSSPTPSGFQQQQNVNTFTQQHSGSPTPASNIQQHSSHTSTSSHHTTTHHGSTPTPFDQQHLDTGNTQELQQWMGSLNSPLIRDHQDISGNDGKCLRLRFDVSQYSPDEVSVKTVDGKLRVHAKHEEKSEHKSAYREFNKEFSLPIGTNPESIKSTLSKDGILTVEAPLPTGQQGQLMAGYPGQQSISNF